MKLTTIENFNPPIACTFDPDLALIEASARGDGSAFEQLVRSYPNVIASLRDFRSYHHAITPPPPSRLALW